MLKLVLLFILKGVLAESNTRGVQLWRTQGDYDHEVLKTLMDRAIIGDEIWIGDNNTIDFLLFNEEEGSTAAFLVGHKMTYLVLIKDVRGKLEEASVSTSPVRRSAESKDTFTWTSYPSLHEVNEFLLKIVATYPTHCKLITLGKTSHYNPIYMLKITNGAKNNKKVLVDSGMHGREWTSVTSTLYFIDSIVRKFYQQPAYITSIDWYIIPVLNPDGYDYSLTADRLWKKNRRRLTGLCYGVDLNRNFDYIWDKQGTTLDQCSMSYCGPAPFSEEETKAFKKLADSTHFNGYISVHSAGNKVLYPSGASHYDHHIHLLYTKEIALAMREVDNYQFLNRNIMKLGRNSFGMAMDWMHFVKEVRHTYIIETRGQNGLDIIPRKDIILAAKEVRAGLMKFAEILK